MLGVISNHEQISEGADPDCFVTKEGGHVSWIVKDPKTELWTINLSTFDKDIRLSLTRSPASKVANLVTRPYLGQFEGKPCLIYLNTDRAGQTEIHTYFIESHLPHTLPQERTSQRARRFSKTQIMVLPISPG
jgi:hypothetical protein